MTDTTALNAETATLLAAFMWRRRLNSVTLANATHRRPGKVIDGTSTQVKVQMINRCRVKMSQEGLYKFFDPLFTNSLYWAYRTKTPYNLGLDLKS